MQKNILFFLLSLLVLGACSGLKDRANALDETLRGYEKALRWTQYETLVIFHHSNTKASINVDYLRKLRVSSYTVQSSNMADDHNSYLQSIEIKYYFLDEMKEKTIIDDQTWGFNKDTDQWLRTNALTVFP